MTKENNAFCIVCSTPIYVEFCCDGRECGCMGQPSEPPVCSGDCYDELMSNMSKYYPTENKKTAIVSSGL
jgi:hypothetical protein